MDHILAQVMPKNFLESDDELDVWSSTSSSSSGRKSISPTDLQFRKGQFERKDDHFSIFQDYFGLSNLLQNVKISDDNPLLYENRRNLTTFNKTKRLSWESDGSDPNVVISPIGQNIPFTYGTCGDFPSTDNYQRPQTQEPTFKNLPPPSMRLSKAARDQIISGAYQNQLNRCRSEKIPSPPPQPPQSHVQLQVGNMNTVRPQATVQVCVFCRNNGESEAVYSSHVLKDAEGRTSCPILRAYTCPICKANGDNSHTIKYCPLNQQQNGQGRLQQQQNANFIGKGNRGIRPPPLSMNGRVVKPH